MTQTREQVLEQYRGLLQDTVARLYEGIYTGELAEEIENKLRDLPDPEKCPSAASQRKLLSEKVRRLRGLMAKRGKEAVDQKSRIKELESLLDQQEQQYYRAAEERDLLKKRLANADTIRLVKAAFSDSIDRSALSGLIVLVQDFLKALEARDAIKMYEIGLQLKKWVEQNRTTIKRYLNDLKSYH
jgi:hypothetical protein